MATSDPVMARRSTRNFKPDAVGEEKIERLLRAAMNAPSASNEQPWHFLVTRDKAVLQELNRVHPIPGGLLGAPVAIVVCADPGLAKEKGFWIEDCSAAVMNILIEAEEIGLGSVWLGLHPDKTRVDAVRRVLGIPEEIVPFAIVPTGYSNEVRGSVDRYQVDRVHHERW
jgi:nitroreductase